MQKSITKMRPSKDQKAELLKKLSLWREERRQESQKQLANLIGSYSIVDLVEELCEMQVKLSAVTEERDQLLLTVGKLKDENGSLRSNIQPQLKKNPTIDFSEVINYELNQGTNCNDNGSFSSGVSNDLQKPRRVLLHEMGEKLKCVQCPYDSYYTSETLLESHLRIHSKSLSSEGQNVNSQEQSIQKLGSNVTSKENDGSAKQSCNQDGIKRRSSRFSRRDHRTSKHILLIDWRWCWVVKQLTTRSSTIPMQD